MPMKLFPLLLPMSFPALSCQIQGTLTPERIPSIQQESKASTREAFYFEMTARINHEASLMNMPYMCWEPCVQLPLMCY